MKLALRTPEKKRDKVLPGVHGTARLDRRVARLIGRLNPGDIAVIDVADLDRSTADALVSARVSAVVNVRTSISGRYPTLGASVLLNHDIPLLDEAGPDLFANLKDGTRLRLDGQTLFIGERLVATGVRQDTASIEAALTQARDGLSAQLQAFAAHTQSHMQADRELLIDGVGIPTPRTTMAGRHVLLVARGYDFASDLKALRHYIREFNPVLVGVDGGGDVLLAAGYRPAVLVGDAGEMSDDALRRAADVVLHTDHYGRADGLPRVQDLRVQPMLFATSGTSEDAAMLLAEAAGANLIVTVGMRATLEEFLDSSRGGIASSVLTRLKLGGRVIDGKSAAMLYQARISPLTPLLVVLAAFATVLIVLLSTSTGDSYLTLLDHGWHHVSTWVEGLFS